MLKLNIIIFIITLLLLLLLLIPIAVVKGQKNNNNNNNGSSSVIIKSTSINHSTGEIRYDIPDDCRYTKLTTNSDEISLLCSLRTINSEFDTTNFSVIPSEHTIELKVVCNDDLMIKSNLEPKCFGHLIRLKSLIIKFCKLSKFHSEILYGLSELRNLTLQTDNIIWIDFNLDLEAGSFEATKNLERLDLSQNNIWTLPNGVFCPLNRLIFLNISENRLQDINELGFRDRSIKTDDQNTNGTNMVQPTIPCSLDLEILDMSFNNFVLLPINGFGILKRLKILKLNNNEISMVADKALNGLKNLKILNLSSNKIVALPSELFTDCLHSIQEVYLQNNSITVLSPKLFSNLEQLQALDLSFNQITSNWIDKNTFLGLIRLVLLNLSHNKITKLESDYFLDLYTLQILNLKHNQLDNIEANTFSLMNNLHTLLLSYNNLKSMNSHALNGLYVLSLISLDNNQLADIHVDAFRNCSSLQDINLNGNELKDIPIALRNMRLLRTIDLGENLISKLNNNSFKDLHNLYGLRLIGNNITKIKSDAFKDLPSLQILNLAHNKIDAIETDSFKIIPKIQAIRLDGNFLNNIDNLFQKISSLLWLNISDNNLQQFDFNSIPISLQWLDIHKNEIITLSNSRRNLTGNGNEIKLQTLDASFNRITKITPNSIPNSMELLFLNDNQITSVEPNSFMDKPNLTRVDLYANQIKTLDEKSFRILQVPLNRTLPEFYIGGNPFICNCNIEYLQKINQLTTRQYPKIMDLETIYCKLLNAREKAYIPLINAKSKHFLCSYTSHCFALCHCCEFDACDCEMTCPNNCTCFHDQSWSTNIVDCSGASYNEIPANIPMDTTEVYLDGNNLIELSGHSFIGRKNLIVLYANNSNIQFIYNTTFSGLKRLEVLNLAQNKIIRLYGNEFNNLENLKELYLNDNKISIITNGTFINLKKLELLRLDGNKLVQFEVYNQLMMNKNLNSIGLAGNLWSCECSYLSKLRNYLQMNSEKILDANRVACIYNNMSSILKEKNGTKCTLREGISTYVRASEIENLLPLLLVGTCAFIGFFGLILGLFCYRREICVLAQSNTLFKWCFKSNGDYIEANSNKDRFYDAYICNSLQDEHFINHILADTLENIGYRLSLHYRDLNLNLYITDAILETVECSKQAVLVLSKNFLYNEWTRFEYKSALHELINRRKKLVIILYGDLPTRDIDSDMRHYLKTNTCIEWDDKKFWQKFRIALPQPNKGSCMKTRSAFNIYGGSHHNYQMERNNLASKTYDCRSLARINNYSKTYDSNFEKLALPSAGFLPEGSNSSHFTNKRNNDDYLSKCTTLPNDEKRMKRDNTFNSSKAISKNNFGNTICNISLNGSGGLSSGNSTLSRNNDCNDCNDYSECKLSNDGEIKANKMSSYMWS